MGARADYGIKRELAQRRVRGHLSAWQRQIETYRLCKSAGRLVLAEAVRFELTDGLPRRWFSRPVHSTALARFRMV